MAYNIVPMGTEHVPQLAELERSTFSDPWPADSFTYELSNPISLWLVAQQEGRVLGYVGSQIALDEADMMNLAVREECRKTGIGEALVRRLEEELKARGVVSLFLEVRDSNEPAIRLYHKLGFSQVGLRKKYYFHPVEDARILKKEFEL